MNTLEFDENDIEVLFHREIHLNDLDEILKNFHSLGIIQFVRGGEDGFVEQFSLTYNKELASNYLIDLIKEYSNDLENEVNSKTEQLRSIYSFSPENIINEINNSKLKLNEILTSVSTSDYLKALEPKINEINTYLTKTESIIRNYENIYLSIIKPIKQESKQGIRSTTIWAIISIILTSIVSLYLSNSSYKLEHISANPTVRGIVDLSDIQNKVDYLFYERTGLNKDFISSINDTIIISQFERANLFISGKNTIEIEPYYLSEIKISDKYISTFGTRIYLDGRLINDRLISELFKVTPSLTFNEIEGNCLQLKVFNKNSKYTPISDKIDGLKIVKLK